MGEISNSPWEHAPQNAENPDKLISDAFIKVRKIADKAHVENEQSRIKFLDELAHVQYDLLKGRSMSVDRLMEYGDAINIVLITTLAEIARKEAKEVFIALAVDLQPIFNFNYRFENDSWPDIFWETAHHPKT